jgi:hypothetical protein
MMLAFLFNGRDLELLGFVLAIFFWVQMLRYCVNHERNSPQKVLWLVVMIVLPGIGSLLYYLVRVARVRM